MTGPHFREPTRILPRAPLRTTQCNAIGLVFLLIAGGLLLSERGLAGTHASSRRLPAQTERTRLDLTKKETYVLLSINADPRDVRITNVRVSELPTPHQLVPDSGEAWLGRPLDIQLKAPGNVRIRLAVVKRGHELAVRISPQIVLGKSNTIELTQNRLTRAARNLQRRIKHLNSQLAALSSERKALDVWLITPGNKPLKSVKMAHMRLKILADLIKARQREVPLVQQQCQALAQAAEFVRQLHQNVEIEFQVDLRQRPLARGNTEHRSTKSED